MNTPTAPSQAPTPASSGITIEAKATIQCITCKGIDPVEIRIEIHETRKLEESILHALEGGLDLKGWELLDTDPNEITGLCPLCRYAKGRRTA